MKTCKLPNCEDKATRHGLCNKHYMREYRRKQKTLPTYDDGREYGRQEVVDAIDDALLQHGGKCRLWQDAIHLTIQGNTLKIRLRDERAF